MVRRCGIFMARETGFLQYNVYFTASSHFLSQWRNESIKSGWASDRSFENLARSKCPGFFVGKKYGDLRTMLFVYLAGRLQMNMIVLVILV